MGRGLARNDMRERLAQIAARLMAEDGIEDFALAKRKAARQAGIPDSRQLPDNDEIEAALRSYRALYQQDYPLRLSEMRHLALDVMTGLAVFNPHLTGALLNGIAGNFADIHLQLFAESDKAVEFELLNRGIRYRTGTARLYAGEIPIEAAVLSFEQDDVTVHLTLLSPRQMRGHLKSSPGGRVIDRANQQAVAALLG